MLSDGYRRLVLRFYVTATSLCLCAFLAKGLPQSTPEANGADVRELTNLVRDLQGQVKELSLQLLELRGKEEEDRAHTQEIWERLASADVGVYGVNVPLPTSLLSTPTRKQLLKE